jgi:S1-C subfamily serine protease
VALVLAACGGGGHGSKQSATGSGTAAPSHAGGDSSGAAALQARFVDVVKRVSPQVVQISTSKGLGSGVVYDRDGDVVTNNHVVQGSRTFRVTLSDGRSDRASLVGSFPPEDLAVVRLGKMRPGAATFGDSSKLAVGQFAFAIGNPLGLRSSVTQGVISSLGRTVSEGNGAVIASAIQTSAPINPGNSGGALVDLDANVVGIPTLAALDPELGGSAAPGIGFAIPSNTVKRIAGQLVKSGIVTSSGRAYLGVQVASTVGGAGVIVAGVAPGGPAAKAGIRPGSVITAINHQPVASTDDLATALAMLRPGQKIPVDILDPNGAKRTVTVALGQIPGGAGGG